MQLWKWVITQTKVQWQHYGPEEAAWEDEKLFRKAYLELFGDTRHRDDVQSQEGEM